MKKHVVIAAIVGLFGFAPAVMAQSEQPSASMKGPPNANGAQQQGRSDSERNGKPAPNADANGAAAAKATDKSEKSQ